MKNDKCNICGKKAVWHRKDTHLCLDHPPDFLGKHMIVEVNWDKGQMAEFVDLLRNMDNVTVIDS
jgi:hypothetical protein